MDKDDYVQFLLSQMTEEDLAEVERYEAESYDHFLSQEYLAMDELPF